MITTIFVFLSVMQFIVFAAGIQSVFSVIYFHHLIANFIN
jgi:hypothetical protein